MDDPNLRRARAKFSCNPMTEFGAVNGDKHIRVFGSNELSRLLDALQEMTIFW